jgi:hypothetical protein
VGQLSEDGTDISTTYQLVNPQVLFAANVQAVSRPGTAPPAITLKQRGGSVTIDGHVATVTYSDSAKLVTGMDVVLLLKGDEGDYRPAARLGIFAVQNSSIVPLVTQSEGDHMQFKGMNEKAFVSDVVARRQKLSSK